MMPIQTYFDRTTTNHQQYKILKYIAENPNLKRTDVNLAVLKIAKNRRSYYATVYADLNRYGLTTRTNGLEITSRGKAILRLVETRG